MEKGYMYNIEEPKSGKAVKVAAMIFAAFICMAIGILVGCEIIMRPQVQALEEESRAAWDAYNYERSRTRDDSAIGWMFGDMTEEEVAQLLEHYGQVLSRATDDLNRAADYIIAYQTIVAVYEIEHVPEEDWLSIEEMLELTADWREWDENPANWGDADFDLPDIGGIELNPEPEPNQTPPSMADEDGDWVILEPDILIPPDQHEPQSDDDIRNEP